MGTTGVPVPGVPASPAFVGQLRARENMPPIDAAVAIARVLGVTAEQLDFRRRHEPL